MAPAIALTTATLADLGELEAVFRRSSLHGPAYRDALVAHPELFALDPAGPREGRTRAALDAATGRVVGFATLGAPGAEAVELDDLFVDPPWMGQGVGRALVADLARRARALGCAALEVTGNPQALAFYERVGFVTVGEVATPLGPAPRLRLALDAAAAGGAEPALGLSPDGVPS